MLKLILGNLTKFNAVQNHCVTLENKTSKKQEKKKSGGERAGELGRNTKTPALCWWTYTGSGTATLTWSLMCCPQPSHWFLYSSSICAVGLVSPLKEGSQPSLCAFSLGFSRLGTFQAITFVSDCVFSPLYPELCFGLPFLKCLPLNGLHPASVVTVKPWHQTSNRPCVRLQASALLTLSSSEKQ